MTRLELYELPADVRALLVGFAAVTAIVGFWLTNGAAGLVVAGASLSVRAALSPAALVRIAVRMRRRQLAAVRDDALEAAAVAELAVLSERAGCAVPTLSVIAGDDLEAFAIAGCRGNAIVVSEGLLGGGAEERVAVLAHELAHLRRRDALLVSALLIGPVALLAAAVGVALGDAAVESRLVRLGELAPVVPSLLLIVASATLAIQLVLRPRLEWSADAGAVSLVGGRRALVRALEHRIDALEPGSGRDMLVERLRRLSGPHIPR